MSRHLFLYYGMAARIDRDEVEEALTDVLGSSGEVSGAGSGMGLVNLDVEIFDTATAAITFSHLDRRVSRLDLPPGAFWQWEGSTERLVVGSG